MTRAQRGWLAGILDGEGTIAGWLREDGRCKCGTAIYNTNPKIIEAARSFVGEIIGRQMKVELRVPADKTTMMVRVDRMEEIIALLETLKPDLRGKRDQVVLLVEHLKIHVEWQRQHRWSVKFPEGQIAECRRVVGQLHLMNHRYSSTRNGHTEVNSLEAV